MRAFLVICLVFGCGFGFFFSVFHPANIIKLDWSVFYSKQRNILDSQKPESFLRFTHGIFLDQDIS